MIVHIKKSRNKKSLDIQNDGFVSLDEAASFLSISRSHLYNLMDAGQIAYAKLGRARRIPKRSLRRFVKAAMHGELQG